MEVLPGELLEMVIWVLDNRVLEELVPLIKVPINWSRVYSYRFGDTRITNYKEYLHLLEVSVMVDFINKYDGIYYGDLNLKLRSGDELIRVSFLQMQSILSLECLKLKEIPKEIGSLVNLTYLNLAYNPFTEFPVGVLKLTKLANLNLEGSKIIEIPKELAGLPCLRRIYLTKEKQTNHHIYIPDAIKHHFWIKIKYENVM
jgi:hypothetical protein